MGLYKIGWSKDIGKRIKNLVKLPFNIKIIHKIKTDNPRELENNLHNKYKSARVNGEWFGLTDKTLEEILNI